MCQLTVVNLNDKKLNQLADYLLSYGPSKFHSDGFGIMQNGRFLRTQLAPNLITNLGSWSADVVTSSSAIYSHIRQASTGVEVCVENSHPFESENFLLMHNGTLTKVGNKRSYVHGRESDSKQFLSELEEQYKSEKNFVKCFNNAMKNFWGKFAFLIYHKIEKKHYIVRGTSASLWKIDLLEEEKSTNVIGFIVNTEKENLLMVDLTLRNLSQILNKKDLHFSEPISLKADTIYVQDGNTLSIVGETKENYEVVTGRNEPTAIQRSDSFWPNSTSTSRTPSNYFLSDELSNRKPDTNSLLYKIVTFQIRNWLSPKDVALIYSLYMKGESLLHATEGDLNTFVNKIVPKLDPKGNVSTLRFLKNELKGYTTIPAILYTNYGLEYPWMLNSQKEVINAVRAYCRDMEKAKNERTN